ncbi:MAG TPA: hypothetical protein VGK47_11400 [Nitrososphaeraceae archaeon]
MKKTRILTDADITDDHVNFSKEFSTLFEKYMVKLGPVGTCSLMAHLLLNCCVACKCLENLKEAVIKFVDEKK